jgi:hypothetical protein
VNLARWRQQIPADAWPDGLPSADVLWRHDVFRVADGWRAGRQGPRSLLTAACLWGYGRRGYGLARTLAVLAADPDGGKLEHNLAPLREGCPAEDDFRDAYTRFGPASRTHLNRLGPAFFSKLLYFGGYRRSAGGVQPLILDRRVAASLPEQAGAARSRLWGWPAADWIAYLRWAAGQASRQEFGGEPDAVEMALFDGRWTPGQAL